MTAIPPRTRMPVPEALARPNVVAPQPYSLPTPTRFRLSNGAKGLAYDLPGQYVLSVRMAIPMPLRRVAGRPPHAGSVGADGDPHAAAGGTP